MTRRWTEKEIAFLEANARSMTSTEIGGILRRSACAVRLQASRRSISLAGWTEQEDDFLRRNARTMTAKEIAKKLERPADSVSYRASCIQVSLNALGETSGHGKNRKYSVNHRYFANMDEPIKAYWLGVLWADGSVYKQKVPRGISYIIKLELQASDKGWLQMFAADIDATYPLSRSVREHSSICLRVSSEHMFRDLVSHGVVPRKTYKNHPPDIPDELTPHFVRGLVDGDGTIGGTPRRPLIRIVNTQATCEWLLNTTQEILGVGGGIYPKTNVAYIWALGGARQGNIFANWIYHSADRCLERKYEKFMELGLL